jgi:hypothetical protein
MIMNDILATHQNIDIFKRIASFQFSIEKRISNAASFLVNAKSKVT